ncbi:MAG: excinuclease ABC subunit C [Deltaproteobacteria bacterium]|nr:excinuclease ABC subunit C [Deltaproteobacteria bacterium]
MINIQEKIKAFPTSPGVYLMKDVLGKILYIGKAKNLRSRVRSYFLKRKPIKTRSLVNKIRDIDFIATLTETEALLLECELIKKNKPYYNVSLKDDKSYPYLKITTQEEWPGIYLVRRPQMDKALYFGPYSSVGALKQVLKMLTKIFQMRDCSNTKFKNRSRPCLSYEIGRCTAPCVQFVSPERYSQDVDGLVSFLRGRVSGLEHELKKRMKQFSADKKYEDATHVRDQLIAISDMMEKQNVISKNKKDQDVIAFEVMSPDNSSQEKNLKVALLFLYVRAGVLLSKREFQLDLVSHSDNRHNDIIENLKSFLTQYYESHFIPKEILISSAPPDGSSPPPRCDGARGRVLLGNVRQFSDLSALLSQKISSQVSIHIPKSGEALKLTQLAHQNLKIQMSHRFEKEDLNLKLIDRIQKLLHLKRPPHHIECYDISNISGTSAVGSLVTFKDGEFQKNLYKRFKIKTVEGIDDFSMMREVLRRRFLKFHSIDGRGLGGGWQPPDLLLIDGGRGHLGAACQILDEFRVPVDVASIAKKKIATSKLAETERLYLRGRKNPFILKPGTELESFFAKIRDEAHRFAITYHRKLRSSSQIQSILDEIPGLGQNKKKRLLEHFLSVDEIKFSTVEELSKVPGISSKLAEKILQFLGKR